MPRADDFSLATSREYDPAEAWEAKVAAGIYEHIEEAWQEDYAASLMTTEEANAKDYYWGLYRFIDDLTYRLKTASMRAFERGEWKELP